MALFKNHPVVAKALRAKTKAGYNVEFDFVVLSEKCQLDIWSKDLLATMTASSSHETTSLSAVIRQVSSPDVVPEVIFVEHKKMPDGRIPVSPYYIPVE